MFRELARKNKQLPQDECLRILREEKRGVLAVTGDGGYPYAMPMNHFYCDADGCIYFHCGKYGHRLDALRRDNRVSFCAYQACGTDEEGWAQFKSVVVFGRMAVLDDAARIADIAAQLSRKFTQDEAYIAKEIRVSGPGTLLLQLTPEHLCGKFVTEK